MMAKITWVLEDEPTTDAKHGDAATADVTILVNSNDDGTQDFYVDCHCGACTEMANVGVREAMGIDKDDAVPEGTHFMEFFVEKFTYPEGVEYESGLRYTEGEK